MHQTLVLYKGTPRRFNPPGCWMLALNQNGLPFGDSRRILLRDDDMQDTTFIRSLDVLLCHVLAHKEAALHHARIALLTEHLALLVLVGLLQRFLRGDGQITVVQFQMNVVLLEARQINVHLIAFIRFLHIRLHHVLCVLAVQRTVNVAESAEEIPVEVIKNVHQVLAENSRKIVAHNANLHSFWPCTAGTFASHVGSHIGLSQVVRDVVISHLVHP